MAASTYSIQLKNGQTLSVYQASSQAVGSSPVCSLTGPASSSTTTTDFVPASDTCIDKIVVPAALTAGSIEIYNVTKSQRSGKTVSDLSIYLVANALLTPPKICFRGGQTYRLMQVVAGNA